MLTRILTDRNLIGRERREHNPFSILFVLVRPQPRQRCTSRAPNTIQIRDSIQDILIFFRDITNGGLCNFDPVTNLPDENCAFFPSRDGNNDIRSSLMAAPFLKDADHFCEDTETTYHHDAYKPTKHNFMCDRRSTWDVILHSKDFTNVVPSDGPAPETIFNILQPYPNGRFTLVLDKSASMEDFDRMKRVRKAK